MVRWYYSKDGCSVGPIDATELKKLAATGQLPRTDQVWKAGTRPVVEARQVRGLFPTPTPGRRLDTAAVTEDDE